MAAVVLMKLHWSADARRMRPMLQCGPTGPAAATEPAADGNEPRYTFYLISGATPEEACERASRQSQALPPEPR
jgi:hypothetical protein